jgi:hypothetical protein
MGSVDGEPSSGCFGIAAPRLLSARETVDITHITTAHIAIAVLKGFRSVILPHPGLEAA